MYLVVIHKQKAFSWNFQVSHSHAAFDRMRELAYYDLVIVQEKESKAREQRENERLKKIREIKEAESRSAASSQANQANYVRHCSITFSDRV